MNKNDSTILLSGGEIALWTDDDRSIHIKAVTSFGDPVELNAEEARELAEALVRLASAVD
jgi:hypothetical protein